jgi:hypothetical protein
MVEVTLKIITKDLDIFSIDDSCLRYLENIKDTA